MLVQLKNVMTLVSSSKPQPKRVSNNPPEMKPHDDEQQTIETLRAQLTELEKAKQECERKTADYFDRLQRLQAEMENLQKITRRQIETITNQASRDLTGKLLPILDALRQAGGFAHGGKTLPSEEIAIGLDMLYSQLMDILRTVGLEEIKAVGHVLDPAKHEVVSYDELSSSEENSVVEEVRKGYILNGKVIRPSMVIVAKHKVAEGDSTDEAP